MEVICFEDKAFFEMLDKLYGRFKSDNDVKEDMWISGDEAMKKLRITSKTTLQKLRDEGKIRYSQPTAKIILYETKSIYEYLEDNAYNTF